MKKFLLCCRCCQAPLAHFFLPSVLFFTYRILQEILLCSNVHHAHLTVKTVAGIGKRLKVRGDPGHHPWVERPIAQSHGSIELAAPFGRETRSFPRTFYPCEPHARHPILYASFDESGKPRGGDPI